MVREGFTTSGVAYAEAIAAVHAQTRRFAAGMSGYDVLLVPTLLTSPPPYALLDQPRGTTRAFFDVEFATTGWTSLANVTGWAAISLPLGVTSDGLPIGVQLMAPTRRSCSSSPPNSKQRCHGYNGAPLCSVTRDIRELTDHKRGVLSVPFGRMRHFGHGCRNCPSEVGRQHRRR